MDLLNATKMQAGYTMGMQPDGRESLVVAVKGTFTIPGGAEEPQLAEEQVPLIEADTFTGEPGFSAPVYESDYPLRKPRCDVLLHGSAYAPGGKPAARVTVSLQIGPVSKSFDVVGHRFWKKGLISVSASRPRPFTVMPISYDNAFGGFDKSHKNPSKHRAYLVNPVGVGFHVNLKMESIEGKPLPNTEEKGNPVTKPNGNYRPMSFGPVGRGWLPRYKLAGTYDQNWLDNIFPFLPPDFDEAYYQSAPADQQMPYPRGGEEVVLTNLTPEGTTRFNLPKIEVPVEFSMKNYDRKTTSAVIDTIVIEPDKRRFMMTWRSSLQLKKNMFEVLQVVVGKMPRAWYRARMTCKTYYPSLRELVRAKASVAEEGE
ncbi:MAG: DUF2169 domain-containing protein [Deferribacteres bacterium]|nr:DUF2169 domain-containing protein [Deferribacteres bacterium]